MLSRASPASSDELIGFEEANNGFIFLPAKVSMLPGPIAGWHGCPEEILPGVVRLPIRSRGSIRKYRSYPKRG